MIPEIINHIWLQGGIPEKYTSNYQKWTDLNPTWQHNMWDEKSLLKLCNHNQFIYYHTLDTLINKVNFLKYILMYRIGGVYVDLDTIPLKSMDNFLNEVEVKNIDLLSTLSIRYPFNTEIPIKRFNTYEIILPARPSLMYYPNGDKAILLDNPFLISSANNIFWINLIEFCSKRTNYKEGFGAVLPHEPLGPYGMTDFLFNNYPSPYMQNILVIPPIYWNEPKTISDDQYIIHNSDKGW